jgi:hypothetical protein
MVPALAPHKARLGHTDRNPRRAPLSLSSVTLGDECADSRDPVGAVTFPRSPLIASAQRRAPLRRCRGLTQCGGLPARSPGQADAARLRRGHQTWMEEAGVSDLLRSERMGHEVPGMRGAYGHVSPAMRADPKAMLQERWEMSCPYASAAIGSLDRPPSTLRPSGAATKIGFQNRTPPLPESGQTDQDRSTWPIRERLLLQVVAGRLHLWPIGSPAARHAPPDAMLPKHGHAAVPSHSG